jgi:hypothetical protein
MLHRAHLKQHTKNDAQKQRILDTACNWQHHAGVHARMSRALQSALGKLISTLMGAPFNVHTVQQSAAEDAIVAVVRTVSWSRQHFFSSVSAVTCIDHACGVIEPGHPG